jgi:diguanylate cyclase (GGDEF)-like protein
MAVIGIGGVAVLALGSARGSLERIYTDNMVQTQVFADLGERLDDAETSVLYALVTAKPGREQLMTAQLVSSVLPDVKVGIANVTRLVSGDPAQVRQVGRLSVDWAAVTRTLVNRESGAASLVSRASDAAALTPVLDRAIADARQLLRAEYVEAKRNYGGAQVSYHANLRLLVVALLLGGVVAALCVLWLAHTVLPRTLAYSRFARRIAGGDYSTRLEIHGDDEIAVLGRTLDDVAQRHREQERHDRAQAEFSDALQLTDDEPAAHDLLRRHLERSISAATVTVLNRNNSADRLEAVTALAPDSSLRERLTDAAPRACLAVRSATVHTQHHDDDPLVPCELCSGCAGHSTCLPLLVGGEVIGAVLVNHESELTDEATQGLHESVRQAAPVVANLRNLAIAQTKAATDTLTGVPNRRALDDTIKRMVAQASRANLPLAALMLDLDHFKQLNDQLGHAKGDEVLAALGTQLQDLLRESDFAARYGGEEFLVLLPATDTAGALVIAEKLRLAVHDLHLPHIERTITASIGIAVLPNHAINAETLERAADRALYLAKTNGRDRVELAATDETPTPPQPTQPDLILSP